MASWALPVYLKLDTMPVASLGIGIGVDYVIYVIVRMQEELGEAMVIM